MYLLLYSVRKSIKLVPYHIISSPSRHWLIEGIGAALAALAAGVSLLSCLIVRSAFLYVFSRLFTTKASSFLQETGEKA